MTCKICSGESKQLYSGLFDDRYGYPGTFDLYQCAACGFAQSTPELSSAELHQLYTDYYPRKTITVDTVRQASTFRPGMLFRVKTWLQGNSNVCHYHVNPGERVLDVGCGDGASLLDIQKLGAEAYGTEYDRNIEPVATQLGLRIFFGDIKDAPYADSWFDTITMSQLLEHTLDPIAFIHHAKQKLKPGGQMILSFPNINSFNRLRTGRKWINWHIPYHLNFFSDQSITLLARAANLELALVRTYTPNQWLLQQSLANHYQAVEGQPSLVWVPDTTTHVWRRRLRVGLALLYSLIRIPLSRAQDAMGKGDSYLVVLTKSKS